eukprot:459040-Pleurochrysis_carterae.AAC.3
MKSKSFENCHYMIQKSSSFAQIVGVHRARPGNPYTSHICRHRIIVAAAYTRPFPPPGTRTHTAQQLTPV